jgi:pyruvate/2-oxoglutarate dehydrogenase complex dihydrolipoamide acyltransferase (E2) component
LPLDVLEAIAKTERTLKRLLEDCPTIPGLVLLESGVAKATEIMQVGVAEAFKTRVDYYTAQSGFCRAWLDEAADETVAGTLNAAPLSLSMLPRYVRSVPSIRKELRKTLQAQIEECLNMANDINRQNSEPPTANAKDAPPARPATGAANAPKVAGADQQELPHHDRTLNSAVAERAARRQAVVNPILKLKRWKRGRLAAKAGLGKNSVYKYLDGTRVRITDENREALAGALDLKPEQIPD